MTQAHVTHSRLFDDDAYLCSFDATVTAVDSGEEGLSVVLDRTAFFPEGGGQRSDVGILNGFAVTDVRETARGIEHTVHAPLGGITVGQTVHGEIDRARRFSAMQCHTAEHILSGLFHTHFGLDNVGFHLGEEEMTMDLSGVLTSEMLDTVELLANRAVTVNVPVTVSYPTPEELMHIPYRSKIPLAGRVRIVTVEGVDICACCAPHVARTGEIGVIKIVAAEKHRGGMRLYVQAGERAYRHYKATHDELHRASTMLSAHPTELAAAVARLQGELKEMTLLYKSSLTERMRERAEGFSPTEENPVEVFPDMPPDAVRTFMNTAVGRVKGILVALMPKVGGGFDFLLASRTHDLTHSIAAIRESLGGRGGGSEHMMQGTLTKTESDIRSYFKNTSFCK